MKSRRRHGCRARSAVHAPPLLNPPERVLRSPRVPSPGLSNAQAVDVAARAAAATNLGGPDPAGVGHGNTIGTPPWAAEASPPAVEEQSPVAPDRAPNDTLAQTLAKHDDVGTDVQGTNPVSLRAPSLLSGACVDDIVLMHGRPSALHLHHRHHPYGRLAPSGMT